MKRAIRLFLTLLVSLLAMVACFADWTIVFKDGVTAEIVKYQIEGPFIHVTNRTGAVFKLKLSDLDLERTNAINKDNPIKLTDKPADLKQEPVNGSPAPATNPEPSQDKAAVVKPVSTPEPSTKAVPPKVNPKKDKVNPKKDLEAHLKSHYQGKVMVVKKPGLRGNGALGAWEPRWPPAIQHCTEKHCASTLFQTADHWFKPGEKVEVEEAKIPALGSGWVTFKILSEDVYEVALNALGARRQAKVKAEIIFLVGKETVKSGDFDKVSSIIDSWLEFDRP